MMEKKKGVIVPRVGFYPAGFWMIHRYLLWEGVTVRRVYIISYNALVSGCHPGWQALLRELCGYRHIIVPFYAVLVTNRSVTFAGRAFSFLFFFFF